MQITTLDRDAAIEKMVANANRATDWLLNLAISGLDTETLKGELESIRTAHPKNAFNKISEDEAKFLFELYGEKNGIIRAQIAFARQALAGTELGAPVNAEFIEKMAQFMEALYDASIQASLGGTDPTKEGLGGCKAFELKNFPQEFHNEILRYINQDTDCATLLCERVYQLVQLKNICEPGVIHVI